MISLTRGEDNQSSGENHNFEILQEPFAISGLKGGRRDSLTKEVYSLVRVDDKAEI